MAFKPKKVQIGQPVKASEWNNLIDYIGQGLITGDLKTIAAQNVNGRYTLTTVEQPAAAVAGTTQRFPFKISLGSDGGKTKIKIPWGNIFLGEVAHRWPFPRLEAGKFVNDKSAFYPEGDVALTESAGYIYLKITVLPNYVEVESYATNCTVEIVVLPTFANAPDNDFGVHIVRLGNWVTINDVITVFPTQNSDIVSPWS